MKDLLIFNFVVAILFTLCYVYQFVYLLVALIRDTKKYPDGGANRFAVVISARNEREVIGNLIDSIKKQSYDPSLIDVFVCADNCTDDTADVSRSAGAKVYERFNTDLIGKGYALDFLFHKIFEDYGREYYNAYLVLDADNLLDVDYIKEMNRVFSAGYRILTSYRNSKNYGSNWISAGYALWFLREAVYLNKPRMILKTSCAVSGTGFMVHRDIINENDGWRYFLLTEDIEFTTDMIIKGEKIGMATEAMLYDEQPETFSQSWRQRLRWARGYLQVFRYYGAKLIGSIFGKGGFSSFDMTMTTMPAVILTIIGIIFDAVALIISTIVHDPDVFMFRNALLMMLATTYLTLFAFGTVTCITEWKKIHTTTGRKILSLFTFPLFMATYLPISIAALFKKVEWKPIKHTVVKSIEDIEAEKKNDDTNQ